MRKGQVFSVGDKVLVNDNVSFIDKRSAEGHICTIKKVNDDFGKEFIRYKLAWNEEDNNGKGFPGCLHLFLFFADELTLIPFPRAIITTGLPDI